MLAFPLEDIWELAISVEPAVLAVKSKFLVFLSVMEPTLLPPNPLVETVLTRQYGSYPRILVISSIEGN